ncbi:hypothetical protein QBC44DRAFT_275230 [Cladorrhinum sp. PSN332]|nr:hypothetical protein QBC44DRAFT_275230 [Cladorrhinum sp. PSN332]
MEPKYEPLTVQVSDKTKETSVDHRPRAYKHARRRFPWYGIAWRFMSSVLCFAILMGILVGFERMGDLKSWEKRGFNTLNILFSAFVSLALGSLLTLLGNMLRWRLLAKEPTSPDDVDLLLGIGTPTGSLKLMWSHTWSGKGWTTTTVVVFLYYIVAILGRISVASLGLTFELSEEDGVDFPVMITDWNTTRWVDGRQDSDTMARFGEYALVGLATAPVSFNKTDQASWTMKNVSGYGLDRTVDGSKLTYTYSLNEYRGLDRNFNDDHAVHSSSSCVARNYYNGTVYHNGQEVGKVMGKLDRYSMQIIPRISQLTGPCVTDEDVPSDAPEYLHIIKGMYAFYGEEINYLWAAGLVTQNFGKGSSGCMTTYIYWEAWRSFETTFQRNVTLYECTSCLSSSSSSSPSSAPTPGLSATVFSDLIPDSNSSYASDVMLTIGTYERVYTYTSRSDVTPKPGLYIREYSGQDKSTHFLNKAGSDAPITKGGNPLAQGEQPWYLKPVPIEEELFVAHLAARLPILTLIGAQSQLPRTTKEKGASEKPFVRTALEVKWPRAIAVVIAINAGALLAVFVIYWGCRSVLIPDKGRDSKLTVARFLYGFVGRSLERTTSVDTGKEMAKEMKDVRLMYGVRKTEELEDGVRELGIWPVDEGEVEKVFPQQGRFV